MQFILSILLSIIFATLFTFIQPWWLIVAPAIIIFYFLGINYSKSFIGGFLAIFITWFVYTLIINIMNDSILATKIAQVIPVEKPILLIVITSFIGGMLGGFGAMFGYSLQPLIVWRKKSKTKYS